MTYDGTQATNAEKLKLYIDGSAETLTYQGTIPSVTSTNTAPFYIGRYLTSGFIGNFAMDELRVWDVTRSASQINASRLSVIQGNAPNLQAYYRFEQTGSATVLPDYSINGYDGTLSTGSSNSQWITSQALKETFLIVSSPNGGQSFTSGTSQAISWSKHNFADTDLIEIRLSTDGGTSYSIIADGTFATYPTNSYTWTVPANATNQAKIQVANTTTGLTDESDNVFAITNPVIALTVVSPNGGQSFTSEASHTITWSKQNIASTDLIEILLSTDGGSSYSIIADGTFATYPTNSYAWTVPAIATNQARIKVKNTTTGLEDVSDSNFIIRLPSSITVTSPNGGETFTHGQQYTVSWTMENVLPTDVLLIRYTTGASGQNVYNLVNSTFANYPENTFTWTIPGDYATDARIEVMNLTTGISDQSDATFFMYPATSITVTYPNGAEGLIAGNQVNITWTKQTTVDTDELKISYSTDGGATYPNDILTSTFGAYTSNSYAWTVPAIRNDQVRIKVENTTKSLSDASNANFKIGDYTAPVFVGAPVVAIVGREHTISIKLDEVATVYYAILNNNQVVTASQVIEAINNEENLTGQLLAGKISVTDINTEVKVEGMANYVDLTYYKALIIPQDAAGNINQAYTNMSIQAQYSPLQRDSVILRTIYNEMGGVDWTGISKPWIQNPITEWAEVKVADGRVTEVDLTGKGLTGNMTINASQMNALTSLKLADNDIEFIPSFANVMGLTILDAQNNKLGFNSIVPNKDVVGFAFDPQQPLSLELYDTIQAGSNYSLITRYLGVGTIYDWKFGALIPGKRFNDNVESLPNGNSQNYTITNIRSENQGTYRLTATHASIPNFALEGENQNIYGKTDLSGVVKANNLAVTKGDVFIYRRTPEGPFIKEDSTLLTADGNYALKDIVLGDFLVQVKPDRSVDSTALQTYYESAERFIEADTLFLNARVEDIDINLLFYDPAPKVKNGARVDGRLLLEIPDVDGRDAYRAMARRKVRKAACSMRKFKSTGRGLQDIAETEIAYYIETDDEGYFNFEGVEIGRYLLNIEFPGVPMDPNSAIEFVVGGEKLNQVFSVDALITETGIKVEQTETFDLPVTPLLMKESFLKDVFMYPNPTQGVLGMDYTVDRNLADLKVTLINIEGRKVCEEKVAHWKGRHHVIMDMTSYGSGLYILIFSDSAGIFTERFRVIKK